MAENSHCNISVDAQPPVTSDYIPELSIFYMIVFCVCALLATVSVALYLETVIFFSRHLSNWKPRDKAVWLLGIYPVISCTSLAALFVPRSSTINIVIASIYLSICVYLFVTMLIGHYGGTEKMNARLAGNMIPLASPPCCCCCFCLPELPVTVVRLRTLQTAVLQYALIKPIISYLSAVLSVNNDMQPSDAGVTAPYTWLSLINVCSTVVAIYSFVLVFRISRQALRSTSIMPKFLCLQLVLVFQNFQHVIISFFVSAGAIKCEYPLTARANGDRWNHICLIVEMFALLLVARHYYRRHVHVELPEERQSIIVGDDVTASVVTSSQPSKTSNGYGAVSVPRRAEGGGSSDSSSSSDETHEGSYSKLTSSQGAIVNSRSKTTKKLRGVEKAQSSGDTAIASPPQTSVRHSNEIVLLETAVADDSEA